MADILETCRCKCRSCWAHIKPAARWFCYVHTALHILIPVVALLFGLWLGGDLEIKHVVCH